MTRPRMTIAPSTLTDLALRRTAQRKAGTLRLCRLPSCAREYASDIVMTVMGARSVFCSQTCFERSKV